MIKTETLKLVNEMYKPIHDKSLIVNDILLKQNYKCHLAFYNGHYSKNEDNN